MASSVRSTALVVTSKPAKTCIWATVIEGDCRPDQRQHAAHAEGKFRAGDVQFPIGLRSRFTSRAIS